MRDSHMGEIDIKKKWPNVHRMQVLGCTVNCTCHRRRKIAEGGGRFCVWVMLLLLFVVRYKLYGIVFGCIILCMERKAQSLKLLLTFILIAISHGIHGWSWEHVLCNRVRCWPSSFLPIMVRDFQAIVGFEAREQFKELSDGGLPDMCLACVGGGCNS